jgi:hypothetical protein
VFVGTTAIITLAGISFFGGEKKKDGHNLFDSNK